MLVSRVGASGPNAQWNNSANQAKGSDQPGDRGWRPPVPGERARAIQYLPVLFEEFLAQERAMAAVEQRTHHHRRLRLRRVPQTRKEHVGIEDDLNHGKSGGGARRRPLHGRRGSPGSRVP